MRVETEVRVAPPGDPLASCAFAWPEGWALERYEWTPPSLMGAQSLLSFHEGGSSLHVHVARFGCEVDGLSFLQAWCPGEWRGLGWEGLPIARGTLGEVEWRVVHTGPALHLLEATGAARALLDGAARTLRSLSGLGPNAEPVATLNVVPLSTLRLKSGQPTPYEDVGHGHHATRMANVDPKGEVLAFLRVLVCDRRVHVGLDPAVLASQADRERAAWGVALGEEVADVAASGGVRCWRATMGGLDVETRRAVRQLGSSLVVVDGVWPVGRSPVARLNGRRHLDVLLHAG